MSHRSLKTSTYSTPSIVHFVSSLYFFVDSVRSAHQTAFAPSVSRADTFFWRKRQPFCHFVTFPLSGNVVNLRNNRILFLAIVGEHPRVLPRAFNHSLMSYPVFLREHSSGSRGRTHGSAPTKNLKLTTLPQWGNFLKQASGEPLNLSEKFVVGNITFHILQAIFSNCGVATATGRL